MSSRQMDMDFWKPGKESSGMQTGLLFLCLKWQHDKQVEL